VSYTPLGNRLFGTSPLNINVWLRMAAFAAVFAIVEQARKRLWPLLGRLHSKADFARSPVSDRYEVQL
jgi:hypothetical protein